MEREETHAYIDARARARIRTHTRARRDSGGGGSGSCWREGSSSLPSREQTKKRTSERASERSGTGAWRARDCVCVRSANHPPPTGAPIVYRDDGLALPNEKRIPLSCKRAPFPAATVAAAAATGVSRWRRCRRRRRQRRRRRRRRRQRWQWRRIRACAHPLNASPGSLPAPAGPRPAPGSGCRPLCCLEIIGLGCR